ncbi:MAG TPA: energy transducer TonB [Candidatus Dormibacteraeota bacterium]|nr:energy transducer TonB [Candidatus Dormibacteraeota bacterium]
MIARLGGVTLSVLLHAGLIALLLAWSAVDCTRPLFVDLVERAESPGSPTGEPSSVRSARPAGRAAGPALPPARASTRPEPVAPVASGGPASAPAPPPVAPAVPPALAIAPEPAAEPAATPAPAPAAVPTAPSASSSVSASDSGSGAVAGGGAQTRGDGDRGSGGGPGASLALVTPGAGGSGVAPPEYGAYLRQFRQRVQESLVYPLAARRQGLGGTVELHVWLEATGRVRDVQVARSSSHRVLDDAAVEAIRRLGPVPFPESLPRRPLLVRIPLVYELR